MRCNSIIIMTDFKTVGIFGNFSVEKVAKIAEKIANILIASEISYRQYFSSVRQAERNEGINDDQLELAIVIGGDGTFMNVARQRAGCRSPLLGVNLGRRGFLTDVAVQEINQSINLVVNGNYSIETRTLLEATTTFHDNSIAVATALNDIVVHKTNYGRLLDFEIIVDGAFVTSLRADGVIVATPTGATAYALSAGGPVLHPDLPAIEMIPISPQTLTHRPIVFSDSSAIEIHMTNATSGNSSLVVDGDVREELNGTEKIVVRRSDLTVDFVRISGHTFYNALRQKLGWGV